MKTIKRAERKSLTDANASAKTVFTGGAEDAHMEIATTITGQKKTHMIKPIRTNHQESNGVTGIRRENRHTGAEEVHFTQRITASTL